MPLYHYANNSGRSGVLAYDDGQPDAITVVFKAGRWRTYVYTVASCGRQTVETLKRLARAGSGLNSFITTHVGTAYARKW